MPPIKVSELADADWELLEIELDGHCPCSEVLDAAPFHQSALVDRKLRILAAAGVPPNKEKGRYIFENLGKYFLKTKKVHVQLYVLKCKPTPWRLYFYVVPPASNRQVEFLLAVPKKGWKRDPKDIELCYRRLDRIDQDTADSRSFYPGP